MNEYFCPDCKIVYNNKWECPKCGRFGIVAQIWHKFIPRLATPQKKCSNYKYVQ